MQVDADALVGVENFRYMGKLTEVVVYTLHHHHCLPVAIDGKRLVFNGFCCNIDLWQTTYLVEYGVIGRGCLPFYRHYLDLGVERGEECSHEVVESIEYTQRDDKCHSGHRHPQHRDGTDEVDGVCALFREEISPGDVEREIHLSLFL